MDMTQTSILKSVLDIFLDVKIFSLVSEHANLLTIFFIFTFHSSSLPSINLHAYTLKLAEQQSVSVGVWRRCYRM